MYGKLPHSLGIIDIDVNEMMFYQYYPLKLSGDTEIKFEKRLDWFYRLMTRSISDFVSTYGLSNYKECYMYITAKVMYQYEGCSFNRGGYHSDGFMTNDTNYIWSNCVPTIFNTTNFKLTMDDKLSINEMEQQAVKENEYVFRNCELLRLDQFSIHKCSESKEPVLRSFVKISFSKDRYDLKGNSHNYNLDYNWDMKERKTDRNIPQSVLTN